MYKTAVKARGPLCSVLAMAIATTGVVAPSIAHAEEEAERSSGAIVVTARKREEDLLKTPIAISALGAEDIEAQGITSVNDLVSSTPGINVSNVNSGRNDRSFQQISLRGFTPSTTSSTLTASFIDGVPVASASALNSVVDPARVEILKGPQNAYFGRNAFAGAMNIVTKDPGNEFGGSVSAEYSSRQGYDVSGSLEGPIVEDILSFRLTGRSFGSDGSYVNRANLNQTLGDQSTNTATLQLNFTPTPNLTIKAFGLYSEDDDGPSAEAMLSAYELRAVDGSVNIPYLSGNDDGVVILPGQSNCMLAGRPYFCGAVPGYNSAFAPAANTVEDPLLSSLVSNGNSRVVSADEGVQGYGLVREFTHLHLSVDYEIGDTGLTLTSLTGYNDEFYSQVDDLDNFDGTLLSGALAGVSTQSRQFWTFPFMVERVNQDFSQEVRLSYDNYGPLQAMLGVSYLDVDVTSDLVNFFNEEQYLTTRSAGSLSAPRHSETWGIFGSLSYDITDALNISLEGRWQRDTISAIAGGAGLLIEEDNQYGLPAGNYAYDETFLTEDYNNFLPRVIVNYEINDDVMVYASYSKAANVSIESFNTQFLNGTEAELEAAESIGLEVVLKPEKLDNYEVGMKGSFFDGRLRVTLAAYHAIWKDQYNLRNVTFLDESQDPPVPEIVNGVANSGQSTINGLELDLWAEPIDGLVWTFAGSINDSSIDAFADPAVEGSTGLSGDDFKGNQLPLASKYSFNTSLQYTGIIDAWDNGSWFVRSDLGWKSKQFVDAGNLSWIKDRAVVNARLGIKKDGYAVEAFVNNLFNDKNYTAVAQNNLLEPSFALSGAGYGYLLGALPRLRTWGVKASYDF